MPGGTELDGEWKRCECCSWMMRAWPKRLWRMYSRLRSSRTHPPLGMLRQAPFIRCAIRICKWLWSRSEISYDNLCCSAKGSIIESPS
jgi:hypothetical protein